MSEEEKYIINPITGDKILSTKFIVEDYYRKCDELQVLRKCSDETNELANEYKKKIDKAIEYINEYAWQEDIIGDMWTTTGEPVKDRYMRLEWDNCNELLEILKGEDKE